MLGRVTASQIASASLASFFLGLHVWLHELRRHQPNRVPQSAQHTCPVVSTSAGLDAHHAPLKFRKEAHHIVASKASAGVVYDQSCLPRAPETPASQCPALSWLPTSCSVLLEASLSTHLYEAGPSH